MNKFICIRIIFPIVYKLKITAYKITLFRKYVELCQLKTNINGQKANNI